MKEFANTIISVSYKWSNLSCFVVANLAPAMPVIQKQSTTIYCTLYFFIPRCDIKFNWKIIKQILLRKCLHRCIITAFEM